MNTLILPQVVEDALHRVNPATTRRNFLRASGALVVTASLGTAPGGKVLAQALANGRYPDPDFLQLDTWIVIHPDNTATFYVGKTDGGQGTGTAFRQMMCDELDIAYDQTRLVMGITDITPDQGGSGGSDGVERDGQVMRRVAAEARRVLLDLASERLNTPVIDLTVRDGLISVQGNPSRAVTYAELVGGKRFDVALSGDNVDRTTGIATVKPQNELRVIGQSIPRYDTPAKVDGSLTWAVDVKVPGMLHARNVRPPVAGATLQSIDESSVAGMPGFVRVVSKGNYVAVVCEREEQAINAARALKAQWQPPAQAPFPASNDVFDFIRTQSPAVSRDAETIGEPAAALASAATRVEAHYDVPFQGHTAIGPAHAMADPTDGQLTIYSNDMKSYGLRNGVAEFLGLPREQVRVVYMDGPQVYGRTAADDAGFEAAYLAHELGRPVRVQWMRDEETAWDTKGPAYAFTLRGGLDDQGKVVALDYEARALDFNHLWYNDPNTVLIAQLMGRRSPQAAPGSAEVPSRQYGVANQRMQAHIVSLPLIWETPLRTGNLRDPNGPQVTFAFESFIDELAAAAHADPVQFRLDMIEASTEDAIFRKARSLATVRAAARAYGWESRPSPNPRLRDTAGAVVSGRGIAYTYRSGTIVAVIAEVDVNRETGHVWVKRLVCAHDCGLVVNPTGLEHTVECGMLHGLSRALWEEVQFDEEKVTSVDWVTHPTMRHSDTPASIEVVIVNGDPNPDRPDLPSYGAGEASHKPMIAAVANAVFDATGVRLRRVPFRKERVLEALRSQT
ncbi:MAG: xanthine dehydrogenase family protein molybdopterin-binding subunit [Gammaproteobacteria bacterium]|nr:xanthine dehydrogenase family protein molybdopterin-binding subunit [Gammaproteobacteria bacterium]